MPRFERKGREQELKGSLTNHLMIMNKSVAILFGMILFMGGILPSLGTAQEIDPFYLQRLNSGEQAFLEGNYETAIEELKIAVFGVQGQEQLKAKACLFLGMSYYHLDNKNEAEKNLEDAKNILGMEGLRALVPDESVWFYLSRVMLDLKLLEPEQKLQAGTATPMKSPGQKQNISTNVDAIVRDLERQIKSSPQNVSLYYNLYKLHMENDNIGAAKKTIKNLIKKNPDEAMGYYFLGRIQYQQRDLKQAEKNLGKVFELQENAPIDEYVMLEAKIYQILSVLLRGDKTRAYRMYAEWGSLLVEDKIRYLDLEEQDRGIVQGIVESEAARAEIEKLESQEGSQEGNPGGESDQGGNTTEDTEVDPGANLNTESAENVENVVPLDQVDTPPVLKERVDPKYPAAALKRGIEGQVMFNALISEEGDVVEVVVIQGMAGGFNEATVRAVKQWKYEPAVKDGEKVKVWKPITITFKKR